MNDEYPRLARASDLASRIDRLGHRLQAAMEKVHLGPPVPGRTTVVPLTSRDHGFDSLLRSMRRRLLGKQIALAFAAGCTDAAVSQWENGKRAPDGEKLNLISAALENAGASTDDLRHLRRAWERAKLRSLR